MSKHEYPKEESFDELTNRLLESGGLRYITGENTKYYGTAGLDDVMEAVGERLRQKAEARKKAGLTD